METKHRSVAVLAKNHLVHKEPDFIALCHGLGLALSKRNDSVITHFSPSLTYVKEAMLSSKNTHTISLSPACSKEEHENIFRLTLLPEEVTLYTGLGYDLTLLTLVRSADLIICLDKTVYDEAVFLRQSLSHDDVSIELLSEKLITSLGL